MIEAHQLWGSQNSASPRRLPVSGMVLNVYAAEFDPASPSLPWMGEYTGWGVDGRLARNNSPEHSAADARPGPQGSLLNIDPQIICKIVQLLDNPADLLALGLSNKEMRKYVADSKACCSVGRLPKHQQVPFLIALPQVMPGLERLNLKGCDEVEGIFVIAAVRSLPRLEHLDATGCRRLSVLDAKELCTLICLNRSKRAISRHSGCALQTLALQKCYMLNTSTLTDVLDAAALPHSQLSTLCMSLLNFREWPCLDADSSPPDMPLCPSALSIAPTKLKILALNNCTQLAADGLCFLMACCPELEMLFLGGSTFEVQMPLHREQGVQDGSPPQVRRVLLDRHTCLAERIVESLSSLPKLKVLELSFSHPTTISTVATAMPLIKVWDLRTLGHLREAQQMLQSASSSNDSMCEGLRLALQAAVDCHSWANFSILHTAVQSDYLGNVQLAVQLGASLERKDGKGATPLFSACEQGRIKIVRALIAAGAVLTTCNRDEEAPLYIAALRGHAEIVQVMLDAFEARQLDWMDQRMYGGGFNPLMAAALSGHPTSNAIALNLLEAAGGRVEELCQCRNKYGLTAAHLAARHGQGYILMGALLRATSNRIAGVENHAGVRPLTVAINNKHNACVSLLVKAEAAIQAQQTKQKGQHAARNWPARGHRPTRGRGHHLC